MHLLYALRKEQIRQFHGRDDSFHEHDDADACDECNQKGGQTDAARTRMSMSSSRAPIRGKNWLLNPDPLVQWQMTFRQTSASTNSVHSFGTNPTSTHRTPAFLGLVQRSGRMALGGTTAIGCFTTRGTLWSRDVPCLWYASWAIGTPRGWQRSCHCRFVSCGRVVGACYTLH